jgi:hypothetical protein
MVNKNDILFDLIFEPSGEVIEITKNDISNILNRDVFINKTNSSNYQQIDRLNLIPINIRWNKEYCNWTVSDDKQNLVKNIIKSNFKYV